MSFFRDLKEKYRQASPIVRFLIWLVIIGLLTVLLTLFPQFRWFAKEYLAASPTAQAGFLIFFFIYLVFSVFNLYDYHAKREKYEQERDEARLETEQAREQKREAEEALQQIEDRLARLAASEESIWDRQAPEHIPFRRKEDRKTRFLSMLNLKGGVGETTLSANLAACLCQMNPKFKVLLIDLDFQANLSTYCVDEQWLQFQWNNENTSTELLRTDLELKDFNRLCTSIQGLDNAKIIVANERLGQADFHAQARFAVQHEEVRFRYLLMHQWPEVHYEYDLVLFDCPPRITTSSVNAVACSDYVLVPTKLDDNSTSAIPRTLQWIKNRLSKISKAEVLGAVANETRSHGGNLISSQQGSRDFLSQMLSNLFPGASVFEETVKFVDAAVHTDPGVIGSLDTRVRTAFQPVAQELYERMFT